MKKILPLLMAVMLVVSLAVPSMAAVNSYSCSFNGHEIPLPVTVEFDVLNAPASETGTYISLIKNRTSEIYKLLVGEVPLAHVGYPSKAEGITVYELTYKPAEGWSDPAEKGPASSAYTTYEFIWVNYDLLSGDTLVMSYSPIELLEPVCDGSTCPAADVNYDGICDDCGMTFAVGFTGRDIAYDLIYDSYERFVSFPYAVIIQFDTGTYRGYLSDAPIYVDDSSGDEMQYAIRYSSDGNHIMVAFDGLTPTTFTETTHLADGKIVDYSQLISANYNLSGASGETFDTYNPNFRSPLWWMTQQTSQRGAKGLLMEVVGTMKILALCGVGCLALLVVLKLFGKRSLIYRN